MTFAKDSPYGKGEEIVEIYCCTFGKHFKYVYEIQYNVENYKIVGFGKSCYFLNTLKKGEKLENFDFTELDKSLDNARYTLNDAREIKKVIEEYFTKIGGTWENTRYTFKETGNTILYKIYK